MADAGAALNVVELAKELFTKRLITDHKLSVALSASGIALLTATVFAPGKSLAEEVRNFGKGKDTSSLGGNRKRPPTADDKRSFRGAAASGSSEKRVAVGANKQFLKDFFHLLRIAFPSLRSKEGVYLLALSVFLLLRTYLSLKISSLTGEIARKMVETKVRPFALAVLTLAAWSIPTSFVNSGLKYLTALLQVSFRENLTRYFHHRYLRQDTFFKIVGLKSVENVDQRITNDVQKWSDEAAEIYSTLFKPIIDIVLFSRRVAEYGGYKGPALIVTYYAIIAFIVRVLAPNFGALAALQQQKDGQLRHAHQNVIQYAEEITLSQGQETERRLLDNLFHKSNLQALYGAFSKAQNSLMDGMLVKYGSVMVGYAVCAFSTFSVEASTKSPEELTGLYMTTSSQLTNLARAVGQFILTYKTISSLSGYTHRVVALEAGVAAAEAAARDQRRLESEAAVEGRGKIVVSNRVSFQDVPVISPDGVLLVEKLTFYVEPGMNLLIVGPNGCGKSSTFRLLGELWPLQGGVIEKPEYEQLYYVPQRPYMSSGTLRDQVIYPFKYDRDSSKFSESTLLNCLEMAHLANIFDKPNITWSSTLSWAGDALSMGEKQRLAMARLFFHRPRFAILDECSSAIDLDVEQDLYKRCQELGISLITIAHRRSVWQYHNWILRFDGNGGFMFSPLRFATNGDLILSNVMHASDPSVIGTEVKVALPGSGIGSKP